MRGKITLAAANPTGSSRRCRCWLMSVPAPLRCGRAGGWQSPGSGGTWAWIAAAEIEFDAHVGFYGSQVPAHLALVPLCPTIMRYGDSDHVVSMDGINRIRAARPEVRIRVYPGGTHTFSNPD